MSDPIARGRKALQRIHQRNEDARWTYGTVGRLVDDVATFDVTGKPNDIYVTIRQSNGAQTSPPARNDANVPHALGLPVRLRKETYLSGIFIYVIEGIARRSDLAYSSPGQDLNIHLHDNRYFTEAEHVSVSAGATNAGDPIVLDAGGHIDVTMINAADIATKIHAATLDTTPLDADEVPSLDSSASFGLIRTTWTSIKAFLKTYFDTLYVWAAGKAGGQTVHGGTAASENLTLKSTFHATLGKILFGNSGYDEVNNRLGIGTQVPVRQLEVREAGTAIVRIQSDSSIADVEFIAYRNSTATHARLLARAAAGTEASPSALLVNTEMFTVSVAGYHSGAAFGTANGLLVFLAAEAFTSTAQGVHMDIYTVPTGSATRVRRGRITSEGLFGFGTEAPGARQHILEATLGSVVQRLQSTSSGDDPTLDFLQGRIATTDATVTTLHTFAIPANNTIVIDCEVIARRTGGTAGTADDGAFYHKKSAYTTKAGTVTLLFQRIANINYEDVAAWDCELNISGTDVLLQVTGAANTNITWILLSAKVAQVGS